MSKEAVCHLWQDWLQGDTPPQTCAFSDTWSSFQFKTPAKGTGSNRCHPGGH